MLFGIGWSTLFVLIFAVLLQISLFTAGPWWQSFGKYVLSWLRVLSVPMEAMPTFLLSNLFTGFVMYNFGYYICFLEDEEVPDTSGKKDPGFVGKHYLGKENEEVEMVMVIRTDLNLPSGRVAMQCCHGSVGIYRRLFRKNAGLIQGWEEAGQKKVLLKTDSEEAMMQAHKTAKDKGLPTFVVRDKKTKILDVNKLEQGNRSVLVVIGPPSVLKKVVGDFAIFDL